MEETKRSRSNILNYKTRKPFDHSFLSQKLVYSFNGLRLTWFHPKATKETLTKIYPGMWWWQLSLVVSISKTKIKPCNYHPGREKKQTNKIELDYLRKSVKKITFLWKVRYEVFVMSYISIKPRWFRSWKKT